MAATSCSPFCDRFNALLIALVQGTEKKKGSCSSVYYFHMCTFTTHFHHSHTQSAINPQSIFHGATGGLFQKLIGRAFHQFRLEKWSGMLRRVNGSNINTKDLWVSSLNTNNPHNHDGSFIFLYFFSFFSVMCCCFICFYVLKVHWS